MGGVLWFLFVLLLVTVSCSAKRLECFHCELGFWNLCHTTKVNCSRRERCFVGLGKAASVVDIKMLGCLPKEDCNKTTSESFPANVTWYNMTKTCCSENYCNGGPKVSITSFTLIALTIGQIMGVFL